VNERRITRIHTAYFGPEPVWHSLPDGSYETIPVPGSEAGPLAERFVPERVLRHQCQSPHRFHTSLRSARTISPGFRDRRPDGRAGWSIYVYDVPPSQAPVSRVSH